MVEFAGCGKRDSLQWLRLKTGATFKVYDSSHDYFCGRVDKRWSMDYATICPDCKVKLGIVW